MPTEREMDLHNFIRSLPTVDERMYAAGYLHHLIGGIPRPMDNPAIPFARAEAIRSAVASAAAAL